VKNPVDQASRTRRQNPFDSDLDNGLDPEILVNPKQLDLEDPPDSVVRGEAIRSRLGR
jgi:hypothetical protein